MAEERGLTVDVKGFDDAMEEARERSRSAQNKVCAFSHEVTCYSLLTYLFCEVGL